MLVRTFILSAVLAIALLPDATTAATPSEPWIWPLPGHEIGERFDKPRSEYGAGHRGIDLSATAGDSVRSVAAGTVAFVGPVGGTPVVTIRHGRERSTYQPVTSPLRAGDSVGAGDTIGTLLGSPSHCASACLHLGRIANEDDYLDPLDLLTGGRFRLIDPHSAPPAPPSGASGALVRPVGGPVTSAFGMRVHPVTGVRKLHDGTDFGVACGTPVHAAADGTVVSSSTAGAYGKQIVVRHRTGLETSYSHLSRYSVSVGDTVVRGRIIGRSGSTGLSTGCHLHFMVLVDGHAVDPAPYL